MHPSVVRDNGHEKCPICFMPLSKRKKGETNEEALPAGVVNRVQLSPYRIALAGINTTRVDYQQLSQKITAGGGVEFKKPGVQKHPPPPPQPDYTPPPHPTPHIGHQS